MNVKRSLVCCRHDLRRLASTPRAWAVLIVLFLFAENQFAPIRQMLTEQNMRISFPGIAVYMLCDSQVTLMLAMGFIMLLFDAPYTDEAQKYIIVRSGRGSWGLGQVLYIYVSALMYLLCFLMCLFAVTLPYADWSGGWSQGVRALAEYGAYEYYNTMLEYDVWLMYAYTPMSGLILTFMLHFLAFVTLAQILYAVNMFGRYRLGFLPCLGVALMDAVMEEYFMTPAYYFSPVSLCRLTMLDYGDEMGRPPVWYGAAVLVILTAILSVVCVKLSQRKELSL